MKESTKEWLGIKPADLVIYLAFATLIPAIIVKSAIFDVVILSVGVILCFISCKLGMKRNPKLGKINNAIKLIAYPGTTVFFLYLCYLNFTKWQLAYV